MQESQFLGAACKNFSVSAVGGKREVRLSVDKKGILSPHGEKWNWKKVLGGSWVHLWWRI